MGEVIFTKIREVHPPSRGTEGSAGVDLFVPAFTGEFTKAFTEKNAVSITEGRPRPFLFNNSICIPPHTQCFIPTGLKVLIPRGSALFAKNKGGVSFKQSITKLAEVVDEDYTDEIFITVVNYSNYDVSIKEGQKLIQLVRMPVYFDEWREISNEFFAPHETTRGSMGSTGV